MTPRFVVLLLSLLLGIQPVTTDLYLPALPAITTDLGATIRHSQLTLSGLLLAFGIAQLIWGPLSDRFGRRPVLLWGLGLYTLAALAGSLASSIDLLIAARLVQGFGMGAAVMCARAMVRDLYAPEEGARAMSRGLSGVGIIASIGLPLGGMMAQFLGWRATLLVVVLFGAALLALIAWGYRETLVQPDPRALDVRAQWRIWRQIVLHPRFVAFTLLTSATYAGLVSFLGGSSFVFIGQFGLSRATYGGMMLAMTLAYLGGTFLCRQLLPALQVQGTVAVGGALSLGGGTVLAGLHLAGIGHPLAILLPTMLYMIGHGIHQPCGQSGAVGPFPQAAGAASALSGFLMMMVAFGASHWLGSSLRESAWPMILAIWASSAVTAAVAWGLVARMPRATPH